MSDQPLGRLDPNATTNLIDSAKHNPADYWPDEPTDPLINHLRCYIAHDVPDDMAVQALRHARAELPHGHDARIIQRAAHLIRARA